MRQPREIPASFDEPAPGSRSSCGRRRLRAAAGAVAITWLAAAPLSAATFRVNSVADTDDGVCGTAAGECTLREAITATVAAPGRDTIRFDTTVFAAGPESVRIELANELPVIADPAGTVVDGAGASVRIDGRGTVPNGLVFTSGSGVALGKVTVAIVALEGFGNHCVHVCGGVPPECDGEVTGALVRNVVAANCGGGGIRVEARVNKKPRVVDSVTFGTGSDGIRLSGFQSMTGARVEGSTATRAALSGIALRSDEQTGSVVVDSFGLKNTDGGIVTSDDGATIKPIVSNVVAFANRTGLVMSGGQLTTPTISSVVATGNEVGVKLLVSRSETPVITKVVADANTIHGINVEGGRGVAISHARTVANGHAGIATETSTDLDVRDVMTTGNLTGVALASTDGAVARVNASGNRGHGIGVHMPGGNVVRENLTLANGAYSAGIAIDQGSGGNLVQSNVSLGNTFDLHDDNADCGTNVWLANVFTEGSLPCIR